MNNELNSQPLLSIIMNCYNGEAYLKESIQSVLSQTYENWELIFWDNRSTDKSAEIFKSYKDKRFKYFFADDHTSLYKARNLAIKKSEGSFIAFLDTDDLWNVDKLEKQMVKFNNPKIGVVFSNFWILKKDTNKRKIYSKQELPSGYIYNKLIKNYNIGIVTTIIKKQLLLNLKKTFDERFSFIGDFDLFLRLSKLCHFESVQTPLASYRLHGGNLSTLNKEKEIYEYEMWLKENKLELSKFDLKKLQKNVNKRKFVNYKIDKKYKKCFRMILNFEVNLFDLKNLIILVTPVIFLKKLLWYHQN